MTVNKVLLFGNLTRDPEMKSLPSGMQVATFGLATNRIFRDRSGNKQEQADFHNIVVFGRQAETVSQYLKKGSSAFVEGRIQTRSWEKDGEKRSRTEIVAERIQFGPKSGVGGGGGGGGNYGAKKKEEGGDAAGKQTLRKDPVIKLAAIPKAPKAAEPSKPKEPAAQKPACDPNHVDVREVVADIEAAARLHLEHAVGKIPRRRPTGIESRP